MGVIGSLWGRSAEALDRRFGWDRVPKPLGVLMLVGLRSRLRQRNLHDTNTGAPVEAPPTEGDRHLTARMFDGTWNDLDEPRMGAMGARFGRNVPLQHTFPEELPAVLDPSPREVSRRLLTRETFAPATTLNVLAAAWLQFEVHDWFSHGQNELENPWTVTLEEDDTWPDKPMRIQRTRRDPTSDADPSTPPTFVTADSHWWDGSQIYGSDPRFAAALRANEDGKLRLDEEGLLPADLEKHVDLNGVAANFWIGLGVLHTLFTAEHNAICDRLKSENPGWTDDRLYDTARLINAALMAKIHTVEWTPGIIAHPTTQYAMRANWWGILGRKLGKRSSNEVLGGIPGSSTNHHGVPYSLTEEFVAVYRMHPLLPDDYTFRSIENDEVLQERTFRELGALDTRKRLQEMGMPSALYSLGVAHPGAIELHNYPRFLQELLRPDGTTRDLAATDVVRVRERGVPRYTEFRRLLGLKPPRTFEEMTRNAAWADELRRVYGDPDRVDTMVGLYAEPKPKGFGFSDTAFRIFILMASRRLKSDRFFTRDFTPRVYTQAGLDWIDQNTFKTVLLRHYPALEPALRGVENGFAPWRRVAA
jgi:Animal haem peroxidase